MIRDFIAIDFETANQQPSSVCSIGVVMVRNGQVTDSFYSLIQPEPNYYNYWCQQVHGLSQCDTDDAPVFSKVWAQLEDKIADVFFSDQPIDDLRYQIASIPFVAHNARFDEGCLKAVFRVYQMDYPDYRFYDTLAAARRQFIERFKVGLFVPMHFVASGFESAWRMKEFTDEKGISFWEIRKEGETLEI